MRTWRKVSIVSSKVRVPRSQYSFKSV